jgi:hypothetical protein
MGSNVRVINYMFNKFFTYMGIEKFVLTLIEVIEWVNLYQNLLII